MSVTEVCEIVVAVPVALGLIAAFFRITWKMGDLLRKINVVVKEVTPNGGKSMKDQLARNTRITRIIGKRQANQHKENRGDIEALKNGQDAVILEQGRVRAELSDFKKRWAVPKEGGQ